MSDASQSSQETPLWLGGWWLFVLLLVAGLIVMFGFYTLWGLYEIWSLPKAALP